MKWRKFSEEKASKCFRTEKMKNVFNGFNSRNGHSRKTIGQKKYPK